MRSLKEFKEATLAHLAEILENQETFKDTIKGLRGTAWVIICQEMDSRDTPGLGGYGAGGGVHEGGVADAGLGGDWHRKEGEDLCRRKEN